ncbi:hypothetical protein NQZ68_037970 [Dissostichus eleginoides]|nr:hypothetical protein NQZ68_037970 [Dissostichus eleginoides]
MSPGKLAVIFGLGVAAGLIIQSGDPLDSWYPVWRETGLLARAVLCLIAGASIFTLGWLHEFLFGPLELLRGPDDVGYIVENGRSKAQAANEVRRRRRTGDLPPVYPNGWYRVLDSHMLRRGEVRSVTVLDLFPYQLLNQGEEAEWDGLEGVLGVKDVDIVLRIEGVGLETISILLNSPMI